MALRYPRCGKAFFKGRWHYNGFARKMPTLRPAQIRHLINCGLQLYLL